MYRVKLPERPLFWFYDTFSDAWDYAVQFPGAEVWHVYGELMSETLDAKVAVLR